MVKKTTNPIIHPNFKSAQPHIENGQELYKYLKLFFDFQHLFHKKIPPCEKNDWLQRRGRDPNSFVFEIGDVDRMYQSSKSTSSIPISSEYSFIGRINNFSSPPPLYVYAKGMIANTRGKKIPSIVDGFIFMSENVNLFMRCALFRYYQTHRNFFNHLCDFLEREDDIFLLKSTSFDPLQQKQILLSPPYENDNYTLLNSCFQIVRNNVNYYDTIPPIMKERIEEENIKEAWDVFNEKTQPPPHERKKCKICLENGDYVYDKNDNYYILRTDDDTITHHQLNENNLCVEMLNFHCDNILEYQHLFKKRNISPSNEKKRFLFNNKNFTIDTQNIDKLYNIYNEYFDLDTKNFKHNGFRVEVIGRLTNGVYFYILAFTLLPQRGKYKGGFIFFSKCKNLLTHYQTMMSLDNWKATRRDYYNWEERTGRKRKRKCGIKLNGVDTHYRDIFLYSCDATHYTECKICFYAKFKPALFNRLLLNARDFVFDEDDCHILNKERACPEMLNYYCDNILESQHLFEKRNMSSYCWRKCKFDDLPNYDFENFTIDIKDIDYIDYIKNDLYEDDEDLESGYSVTVGGKINKNGDEIYFQINAWTLSRRDKDIGRYKWGFIFFSKNETFVSYCFEHFRPFVIIDWYLTKSDHYSTCKICFSARNNPALYDRLITNGGCRGVFI